MIDVPGSDAEQPDAERLEAEQPEAERTPAKPARKRRSRLALAGAGALVLLAVLLALALGVRYGVRTDPGRAALVSVLDGFSIGRFGKLQVSGLKGDAFGAFTIARVAVVDRDGVWIEGRDVAVKWRPTELLQRRFHAERITAGLIRGVRPPHPEPPDGRPEQPLPVAVDIDQARLRLETLPALTQRRGVYDVTASIDMARRGPWVGRVNAASLLRPGDGLDANFRLKDRDRFEVRANAVEAQGGAIAGGLGLTPDEPFRLTARAQGGKAGGDLFVRAQSGATTPVVADGRWSQAGGGVRGRIALGASKLTALLAQYFGPELTFDATARQVRDSRYDLRLSARADNLTLTAAGPVDSRTRDSGDGLRVETTVQDITPIVAFPEIGATSVSGVLKGGLSAFVFEGSGRVQGLATDQYRLAQLAGPVRVELRRGDVNVDVDFQGSGGGGEQLFATLLGGAPDLAAEVSRLRDGRTLIRSLQVRGPGLTVDGDGTRGILGDLSFKGRAEVTKLEAAAPGASGVLAGQWTARQGRTGSPWDFTFDGRGRNFGSGVAELDRLLGRDPRLRVEGAYLASGDTRIERATLDGAAIDGRATGMIPEGGRLDLAVDWRARGPFQAGPVQIAGGFEGDGRITGTIAAPRADLVTSFQELDLQQQLVLRPARLELAFVSANAAVDGAFSLTGASEYGPARARAAFRFVQGGLDLTGVDIDAAGVQARGSLALRDNQPSTADLTVAAGPGAFLQTGRISGAVRLTDGPGEGRATLRLEGDDVLLRAAPNNPVERFRLTGDGPLSRLPFQLSLATSQPTPVTFNGGGVFSRAGESFTVALNGSGEAREVAFRILDPVVLALAPEQRSIRGRLAVGGGTAVVDGRQVGDRVNAQATLDGVEISTFSPDFAGRADARLVLQGQGNRLTGTLNAVLDNARSLDAPTELAVDGRVQAVLTDGRLRVTANAVNAAGLRAQADVDLPAEASAQPLRLAVNRTQPIRGSFAANGELRSLWDLFFGAERTLSGQLTASGTIGGTLRSPRATGTANVSNGRFRDAATGLELRDFELRSDLADRAVVVRSVTAQDGGRGRLSGSGRIGLAKGEPSTFSLDLTRFSILDSELGEATASGTVNVARNAKGENAISGRLRVDEAEIAANPPNAAGVVTIDVVEINKPAAATAAERRRAAAAARPAAAGPAVTLDVAIDAPRGVFVRGRGLDLELSLDAAVRGDTAAPQLTGVARVVRGTFEFAGKRFEFDDRSTIRLASDPANIRLDLTAVRDDPALTARVRVTGTAEEPIVALSSTPQLPQDEILSQVLFGRSASQLTPLEAAQLASSLAALSSGGGFDVVGNLRSLAGLDRLALVGGAAGTAIAGGKYLTDDVYLELIGGGREGPVAEVEWRVRRNLSLVSRLGGESGTRVSVRYRRNF